MRGCGCGCLIGGLLIPIAVIGLMLFVVLPSVIDIATVPALSNVLQTTLCEKGETLSTVRHVGPSYDGGTSYSATYYCTNNDEVRRDVTGRATMIGVAAFVIPFLIGLFMIIGGSMGMAGRVATTAVGTALTMADGARSNSFGSPGVKDSTTERLRALKSAYDQGLITESEYENKRQSILNEM
jgi:hypothetical protein